MQKDAEEVRVVIGRGSLFRLDGGVRSEQAGLERGDGRKKQRGEAKTDRTALSLSLLPSVSLSFSTDHLCVRPVPLPAPVRLEEGEGGREETLDASEPLNNPTLHFPICNLQDATPSATRATDAGTERQRWKCSSAAAHNQTDIFGQEGQ